MGDQPNLIESSVDTSAMHLRLEEDDDEFRSCYEEENESDSENERVLKEGDDGREKAHEENVVDESSVKMYFKGVSLEGISEAGCGFTGIGVVIERSGNNPAIQVQKKLEFYVDESVADYLALIDGLSVAIKHSVKRVLVATHSRLLYDQILLKDSFDNPLVVAFKERIFQLIDSLEAFNLKLVSSFEIQSSLHLAMVAIGIVSPQDRGDKLGASEKCTICCEDRPSAMMINLKCLHKFCSHCIKMYVDGKLQTSQVPIRCPQLRCKYLLSSADCKTFLPVMLYDSFERATLQANALTSAKIYCPNSNCSALVDGRAFFATQAGSSSQSDDSCIECPLCQKFICVDCGVPWHTSLSCEEYQNLPLDERDAMGVALHQLTYDRQWRRCQQCWRMIELTQGCYHMTCRCEHEFCNSCGAEYRDNQQNCECAFWDEANSEGSVFPAAAQETEQWLWDSFDSDQERSQLALLQSFLAGGFSLTDHHVSQAPPQWTDPYIDAMKDLHQLPWLERFVSVISDNYYDDYVH